MALGIIASITLTTINCHLEWWPLRTFGAFVDMTVFLAWNALTLYNFFRAAFVGPGHTPYGWEPVGNEYALFIIIVCCITFFRGIKS